jgi:predicted RNase H-like HicB family nuclease
MRYTVQLKRTSEGYAVWCPGLPGCWSQGRTEAEAVENIKDAIRTYLAAVRRITRDRRARTVRVAV